MEREAASYGGNSSLSVDVDVDGADEVARNGSANADDDAEDWWGYGRL